MTRTLNYLLPLVVIAGIAAGCGSGDPEALTAGGLHVIRYVSDTPGAGNAALLTGIVRDSGGCLTVEDPTLGVTFTPIFPSSMTSPVPDTLGVGDEAALGGGAVDAVPDGATIPEACSHLGDFWLVVDRS